MTPMTVLARDAVAADHLVYSWPYLIGPECEVSCSEDEQVVMCPAWQVGDRLGPGHHLWRTPDPSHPALAFFVLTSPVETAFDLTTSFVIPATGQPVRLRAMGSLQVRCADPGLLIAQFVGLPFEVVNDGVLRSVSRSVERMLARLLTRRVVMAGTPVAVTDPAMLGSIVEELVAYNPTAGAVFGIEMLRLQHLTIGADDGSSAFVPLPVMDVEWAGGMPNTMAARMGAGQPRARTHADPTTPPPMAREPYGSSVPAGDLVPAPKRKLTPIMVPPMPVLPMPATASVSGPLPVMAAMPAMPDGQGSSEEGSGSKPITQPGPAVAPPRRREPLETVRGHAPSGLPPIERMSGARPQPAPAAVIEDQAAARSAVTPVPPKPQGMSQATVSGEIRTTPSPISVPIPSVLAARPQARPPDAQQPAQSGEIVVRASREAPASSGSTESATMPLKPVSRAAVATAMAATSAPPAAAFAPASGPTAIPGGVSRVGVESQAGSRGSIMGIGMSQIGSGGVAGEIPVKVKPGARVLVPGPNGLMQSATVRQLLQGYYELEVGSSGETIWVPIGGVIPDP